MLTLQLNSRNFKLYLFLVLFTVVGSGILSTGISSSWCPLEWGLKLYLFCSSVFQLRFFFTIDWFFQGYMLVSLQIRLFMTSSTLSVLWVLNKCCTSTSLKARRDLSTSFFFYRRRTLSLVLFKNLNTLEVFLQMLLMCK